MKKVYLLFLLALLPFVLYADPIAINGIYYDVNPELKTAEVASSGSGKYSGEIDIPEEITYEGVKYSVTSIGRSFYGCSGLTSVTIPNSVISIDGYAFYNCSGLTSVTIPNSVTSIGSNAFSGTAWYNNQPDGIVYAGKVLYTYKGTMPDGTKVKIKDGTLGISGVAFYNCSGLTSVTIPNSVKSIGDYAFEFCTGLTSIMIPNSVTSIGLCPLHGCSSLTSIIVEEGNTAYYSHNCNAIIETASNTLIAGCNNTTIPNGVTSIGSSSFFNCSGLTSITIPNSVTLIGISAFTGCSGLTSVTIPNSVTTIYPYAFSGCKSLTSISIGSGLTEIWGHAFENSSELLDVYCYAEDVPGITGFNAGFDEGDEPRHLFSTLGNATLHVPAGSVDAYKAGSYWNMNFKEIVGFTGSVKLSKSKAAVEKGKTMTLKATVTLPEKSVTWKSSNTKVATVTSTGKVKGMKAGTATITCTSTVSGAKATCKVTVGYVTLDKSEAFVKKGKTLTLTPTVYPSSLTDKSVTWKSSDESIATVTSEGKVKGVKYGTATITCTSNATGLSTTSKVTVGLVKLDKTNATVEKGTTLTLKPTVYPSSLEDKSVTWTSSAKSIATVSSSGKVKGIKAGTATITCTSVATGLSATCKVTVINGTVTLNKTEAFIEKGKTTTLKATLTPTTLEDMSVKWTSSDKTVATVSSSGKVKGVGYGTATITCTSVATGVSATCQVTIGKVVLNTPEFTLRKTRTLTLVATLYPTTLTDKSVTWKSSDTKVATVTSSGKVKGVGAGTATITCTSNATGLKGTCTVTVLAASESRSIEGDDDDATGIDEINVEPTEVQPYDVYDLSGRKVAHQVTTLEGLPNGLYIVNGKKMLKK